MKTIRLSIQGMSCGHCVAAVRRALADVPGVQVKEVGIGGATIEVPEPAPVDAIQAAVEDAGYFADLSAA
jgi:copper chaperone